MNEPFRSFRKGGGEANNKRTRSGRVPRQVEQYWTFYKRDIYLAKPSSGLPGWLIPLLAAVLIITLVFWGVPAAISRLQDLGMDPDSSGQTAVAWQYDDDTRVVTRSVADVFDQPDLRASRVTQVLYNEPVTLIQAGAGTCPYGYTAVRLSDGTEGYMMTADLTDDRTSVEPALYINRLVVIAATKRIMSHARRGTLLVEAMMGTELFIDYRGAGVSRVRLPDGSSGWISDDGIVILPAAGVIGQPADPSRAFCSSALTFRQVTVLANGQSVRGVSTVGIARLAAAVNGLVIPRTLTGIARSGQSVMPAADPDTGLIDLARLRPGDLVLFSADEPVTEGEPGLPGDLAIHIGDGQILYARPSQTSIRLMNLPDEEDLWRRIMDIRRLYP